MTSEQVYEMAAKMNANKNVETKVDEAPAKAEETKVDTAEPKTAEAPTETATDKKVEQADTDKAKEEPKEQADPKATNDKPSVEKKKVYSKQEQIDYAFKREKAKQKKLEARIRELEEIVKNRPNKTLEDFGNKQADFINYQVDKRLEDAEVKRLQDEYNTSKQAEFDYINAEREKNCFPDEASLKTYQALKAQKGSELLSELDKADNEQVVLGYLDDCDVAPLMISFMLYDDNIKNEILSKRSPYMKLRAMEDLEKRVRFAQAEMAKRNQAPTQPVKPAIPVVGSVTKSEQSNSGKIVKDYNDILHKLNQNRYGH